MIPAMTPPDGELQAPLLLIAMPQIVDPFFHRSVVLLVHHDGEGRVAAEAVAHALSPRLVEVRRGPPRGLTDHDISRWPSGERAE